MVRNFVIVALLLLMQACSAPRPYSFNLADFLSAKELPYDSSPQVIYRLDDHRFVTLERYRDCYHGETFYNDTKANIRKKIGIGLFEDFQGRIVNADQTGMNIVLPLALPPRISCGDRGCTVPLWYSTDGGATFHLLTYMPHSFKPFEDSKDYTVAVTSDKLFIAKKFQYRSDRPEYDLNVRQYTLAPFADRSKPYQPIVESDSAWASKKKLMPDGLRTPSGQDRITCDSSIKPTNLDAPLVR
ncbi:hypothetical protein CFB89_19435 [Burkholderia sp. AU16741]|uniref:T6SS immunity protein Tli3 family protein n=1 Tax=unclassified Burkholderia TaxID=2613784 RepID=UPI000B7A9EBF|nr:MULTISPECIES: hypothetical protein [unclassified Burkholderia]MDN7427665.1 hypothetical protein [Burkholderia sp. AU45388]OXI31600.1 hypothetical protein CFB89_19435 [Burkholderia sp. AU16741]